MDYSNKWRNMQNFALNTKKHQKNTKQEVLSWESKLMER